MTVWLARHGEVAHRRDDCKRLQRACAVVKAEAATAPAAHRPWVTVKIRGRTRQMPLCMDCGQA